MSWSSRTSSRRQWPRREDDTPRRRLKRIARHAIAGSGGKGGVGACRVVHTGDPKRGSGEESALLGGGSRSRHGPSHAKRGWTPGRLHGSRRASVLLAQSAGRLTGAAGEL